MENETIETALNGIPAEVKTNEAYLVWNDGSGADSEKLFSETGAPTASMGLLTGLVAVPALIIGGVIGVVAALKLR